LLELAVNGALVLGIIVDRGFLMCGQIIQGGGEGVPLGLCRRLRGQKGYEALGRIITVMPLDKAMQLTNPAQRIDLDIEK
jgi:hypothetical protein